MKIRHEFEIPAPPERVAEVLCSEQYAVERGKLREGVVSTRHERLPGEDGRVAFDVHNEEYRRTMRGKIDRSGTNTSVIHNRWDPAAGVLSWTFGTPGEKKYDVSGAYRLQAAGAGTRLTYELEIGVHVPLVGGKIARMVAAEIEAGLPATMDLLRRLCAGS